MLLSSFIKLSLSDRATPLLSDCLCFSPSVSPLIRRLLQRHARTHILYSTLRGLHHSGLIFINIEIVEQLEFHLKAPFILQCLHFRIIAPSPPFVSVAESVQQGVLIALERLFLVIKNDTTFTNASIFPSLASHKFKQALIQFQCMCLLH